MTHPDHSMPKVPALLPRLLVSFLLFPLLLLLFAILIAIDTDLIGEVGIGQGWWRHLPIDPHTIWFIWVALLITTIWQLMRLLRGFFQASFTLALVMLIGAYLVTPISISTRWWVDASAVICACEEEHLDPSLTEQLSQPGAWIPGPVPIFIWIPGAVTLWRAHRKKTSATE